MAGMADVGKCRSFWFARGPVFHLCRFGREKLQIFDLERTEVLQVQCAYWNFDLLLYGWLNVVETVRLSSSSYSAYPQAVLVLSVFRASVVKGVFRDVNVSRCVLCPELNHVQSLV